jgi:hypothetical protein
MYEQEKRKAREQAKRVNRQRECGEQSIKLRAENVTL